MNATTTFASASTVMLLRDAPDLQVLMVRRNYNIDFVSGAMVFPGGKVSGDDRDPGWQDHAAGWDSVAEEERALRIAAIREVFEEVGLLICRGTAPTPEAKTPEIRKAIDAGQASFLAHCRAYGLTLDLTALTLFSRWRTPPVAPKRFDTFFYLASVPADQVAAADGRETLDAEWLRPESALDMAARGEREIVFPTRINLKRLGESTTVAKAVAACATRPIEVVEPRIEGEGDERYLCLDPHHGYGTVRERLWSRG